jgi:hypothetical protein
LVEYENIKGRGYYTQETNNDDGDTIVIFLFSRGSNIILSYGELHILFMYKHCYI